MKKRFEPLKRTDEYLQSILKAKIGDIVVVDSDFSPKGVKEIKVNILSESLSLVPDKNEEQWFWHRFVDKNGYLDALTVDLSDKTCFIGGNWEDDFSEKEILDLMKKHNLKHSYLEI